MKKSSSYFMFALLIVGTVVAPSAYADLTRIEQDHPSVSYTGNWYTVEGLHVSGGSVVYAAEAGATASITFDGTGIAWRSWHCESVAGSARVYLDGVLQTTTEIGTGWNIDQCDVNQKYSISGLTHGTHVLTLEVTGVNPYVNENVVVDAFWVETGVVTQVLEENDSAIAYTGTWMDIDDPSVSGGSVLASREAGATATLRWSGERISWIGYLCPCAAGEAAVYRDGINIATRHGYAEERQAQAVIYSLGGSPFTEDEELKIEVTGQSVRENSPWVVIDAFRVLHNTDGPDTTPPEVAIRFPTEGETVYGRRWVVADTFDNVNTTTASVRYSVDGVQIPVDATSPGGGGQRLNYWWTTTDFSDGPHVLTAVARDAAGNETISAPINVIVDNASDRTQPEVTLTAPVHNATVTGEVTLSATATDNVGVARVAFHSGDGTLIGEDTTAPYAITRDTSSIPSGRTFHLVARAHDAAGNVRYSQTVTVTVQH